jgi:hypothetical protein
LCTFDITGRTVVKGTEGLREGLKNKIGVIMKNCRYVTTLEEKKGN